MSYIQPVRGTHDLYHQNIELYRYIENEIRALANFSDFNEIMTPIFESNELFKKPLGQNSDVVLKEMYSFEDRNKSIITLRPEYTTPIIRAAITNKMFESLPLKLFGIGPMFRRERPQRGRYRQFYQINFETFGSENISTDVELIMLAYEFLNKINLKDKTKLCINSLGDLNTITEYKSLLKDYYNKYKNDLSDDSKIKILSNPIRILDSKDPEDMKINENVPKIYSLYSKKAEEMFNNILKLITNLGIPYTVDHSLVRGLDYYCHTVFEFKTNIDSSQNTLIGGGRYDGLIKSIGGPDLPGVGWASGIDRLILLLNKIEDSPPIAQIIPVDSSSEEYALKLLFDLRKNNLKIRYDHKNNIKRALKRSNKSKIKYAIIIGETEVQNQTYSLKNMINGEQKDISFEELIKTLKL